MKIKNMLLFIFLCSAFTLAQQVHEIPFASEGNTIELAIVNDSEIEVENVKVEIENVPQWLIFEETVNYLLEIPGKEEQIALFVFSVDKEAPVKENTNLKFQITSQTGERWTKEINITISPPDKFALYQNYPNPFNPTTIISWQLPVGSYVTLKVYDILGREVETLINKELGAGYHEELWNASNYSSGMYVYQLSIKTQDGRDEIMRKKMMLVK